MGSMKVHQFARGLIWEHEVPSLTLGVCKRLRHLAPKVPNTDSLITTATNNNNLTHSAFDLNSFIRPDSGAIKLSSRDINRDTAQVIMIIYR